MRTKLWLQLGLAAIAMSATPGIVFGHACEASKTTEQLPTLAELEHSGARIGSIDIDTASPAVSPSVVAAILVSQKANVTAGTLTVDCSLRPVARSKRSANRVRHASPRG